MRDLPKAIYNLDLIDMMYRRTQSTMDTEYRIVNDYR